MPISSQKDRDACCKEAGVRNQVQAFPFTLLALTESSCTQVMGNQSGEFAVLLWYTRTYAKRWCYRVHFGTKPKGSAITVAVLVLHFQAAERTVQPCVKVHGSCTSAHLMQRGCQITVALWLCLIKQDLYE